MALVRLNPSAYLSEARVAQLMMTWKHIHHELLGVCYAVMDSALLVPLGLGVMGWARFWQPAHVLAWLVCLMLFSFNLNRLFIKLGVRNEDIPLWTAVSLLITIYISVRTLIYAPGAFFAPSWLGVMFRDLTQAGGTRWPQALGVIIFILVAWMRGLRMATRQVDINRIGLRLRLGGLILAPIIVWFGTVQLAWDVSPYLLLFLLAGLTAVALTRAEEVEQANSGHSASLNPRWLTLIFVAGLFSIITAVLIAALISGESVVSLVGWLAPLVFAIQFLLSVAGLTFVDLLIPVWRWIETAVDWLVATLISTFALFRVFSKIAAKLTKPTELSEVAPSVATPEVEEEFIVRFIDVSLFQQYSNLLVFLLIIAFILLVALLVSNSYRKASFNEYKSGNVPKSDSKNNGQSLIDLFLDKLGLLKNWRTAVSIRRIYRQMSAVADANGFPRLPTETPYEFLPTLSQAWPNNQSETQLITNAFVKVRYGELPESHEELETIVQAWRTLEKTPPIDNTAVADAKL